MHNKEGHSSKTNLPIHTYCPVLATLQVIGGKWKLAIVYQLQNHGVLRFGEIRNKLPRITQKMLTQQLRELEADGILHRKVYAEVPPRVEYRLSDRGAELRPVLDQMASWGGPLLSTDRPAAVPIK